MAVKPCPRNQQFRELAEPAIPVRRGSVQRPQQQPSPRAHFRPRPWLFFIPIVCKNAGHNNNNNNNNKRKKSRTIWVSNDFFIFLKISFQVVSFLDFLISKKKKIGFNDQQCFLFVSLSPHWWSFDVMFLACLLVVEFKLHWFFLFPWKLQEFLLVVVSVLDIRFPRSCCRFSFPFSHCSWCCNLGRRRV